MSGGHFNYDQDRIWYIVDGINELIDNNDKEMENDFGETYTVAYKPETIAKFKEAVHTLSIAAKMAKRIDWLVSGDDGEETFHSRWAEEIAQESELAEVTKQRDELLSALVQLENIAGLPKPYHDPSRLKARQLINKLKGETHE
jgi:hypothetical protein